MSHLLSDLNQAQSQSVSAPNENCLVLAGAGSGKTRVLIRRIAWLIQLEGIKPHNILAVTFTNKAAREMQERLDSFCPEARGLWMGTFHGISNKLLRLHSDAIGLSQDFQVLDVDDQQKMIRQIIKDHNLESLFPKDVENPITPKKIVNWISSQKDHGILPHEVSPLHEDEENMLKVFKLYQERCRITHSVDFADLLLKAYELLDKSPALLNFYRSRFTNILVDEFQDTNKVQYKLIKLLSGSQGKVFAVGDDDQSIYGWRGAMISNIQNFMNEFSNVNLFKLEQNYRSTAHILNCANQLISNNPNRLGKNLWTDNKDDSKVIVYETEDEVKEAQYVAKEIYRLIAKGVSPSECAVLYRSNAQSRALEEQLLNVSIPYTIYGGLRFFERAEVKDFLSYLRLSNAITDDMAFERIVNIPARGLGDKSIQKIRDHANKLSLPLFISAEQLLETGKIGGKSGGELNSFLKLIRSFNSEINTTSATEFVSSVLELTGIKEFYKKKATDSDDAESKLKNLEELVSVVSRFEESNVTKTNKMNWLTLFLTHVALEAGEEGTSSQKSKQNKDSVQMMTIHSSKGLEFPYVFIVGVNLGLFPSSRSYETEEGFFEERRLAYVGITRAMKGLHLVYALRRRLFGKWSDSLPSVFLEEIPADSTKVTKVQVSQNNYSSFNSNQW